MWKNIAAIYSILKKKNYKAKILTGQYLKGKINKNNFGKKINEKKKKKQESWKKKFEKKRKKTEKKREESLWITVVIHSEMCVGKQ